MGRRRSPPARVHSLRAIGGSNHPTTRTCPDPWAAHERECRTASLRTSHTPTPHLRTATLGLRPRVPESNRIEPASLALHQGRYLGAAPDMPCALIRLSVVEGNGESERNKKQQHAPCERYRNDLPRLPIVHAAPRVRPLREGFRGAAKLPGSGPVQDEWTPPITLPTYCDRRSPHAPTVLRRPRCHRRRCRSPE